MKYLIISCCFLFSAQHLISQVKYDTLIIFDHFRLDREVIKLASEKYHRGIGEDFLKITINNVKLDLDARKDGKLIGLGNLIDNQRNTFWNHHTRFVGVRIIFQRGANDTVFIKNEGKYQSVMVKVPEYVTIDTSIVLKNLVTSNTVLWNIFFYTSFFVKPFGLQRKYVTPTYGLHDVYMDKIHSLKYSELKDNLYYLIKYEFDFTTKVWKTL